MGVGFNFTKDKWKPIHEQDPFYIRWVGRTAMWKGPDLMIDFHNDYFIKIYVSNINEYCKTE